MNCSQEPKKSEKFHAKDMWERGSSGLPWDLIFYLEYSVLNLMRWIWHLGAEGVVAEILKKK